MEESDIYSPKNNYPAISYIANDFLQQCEAENEFIVTKEVESIMRRAMGVAFIFGIAFSKTDPNLNILQRLDQAGDLILKTKETE